jgi:predicted site-specific integrase-resolvase
MGQFAQKKRAVIYCRVSTNDQSSDRQEQDLKTYAQKVGYQVIGIYKEATSGAKDDRREPKIDFARGLRRFCCGSLHLPKEATDLYLCKPLDN